jgi:hypothetical protein
MTMIRLLAPADAGQRHLLMLLTSGDAHTQDAQDASAPDNANARRSCLPAAACALLVVASDTSAAERGDADMRPSHLPWFMLRERHAELSHRIAGQGMP